VFGLIVALPLPALYAPALGWPLAPLAIVLHGTLAALPAWLLRRSLLPVEVQQWQRALPIPRLLQLRAEASVAGATMLPLVPQYQRSRPPA